MICKTACLHTLSVTLLVALITDLPAVASAQSSAVSPSQDVPPGDDNSLGQSVPPDDDVSPTEVVPSKVAGSTTLILVVGAGGQDEYSTEFSEWAERWVKHARQQQWNLIQIGGNPVAIANDHRSAHSDGDELATDSGKTDQTENSTADQTATDAQATDAQATDADSNIATIAAVDRRKTEPENAIDANTDAEKLQRVLAELQAPDNTSSSTQVGSRLWLVLIGHGTAMGSIAKVNLIGPDITTTQLKVWLDQISHDTVVIDCTSSSAPFLVELSAKHRIVVTATRSGSEINYARFGRYMSEAIGDLAADLDHDSEVSLLEAFLKASNDTERFYRDNSRLATEHALLDDNGDRTGTGASFYVGSTPTTAAIQGKAIDGKRAARVILWSSPDNKQLTPEQAALRGQIESEIDTLRERKSILVETDYYQQLEELLVKLSAIYDQAEAE